MRPGDIKLITNQLLPAYIYTNQTVTSYMAESTFVVKPTNQIFETFFVIKSHIHLSNLTKQCYAYFRLIPHHELLVLSRTYKRLLLTTLILTHKSILNHIDQICTQLYPPSTSSVA